MPVHVISLHGHHAVFFSRTARQEDAPLVSWGPSSIYVPSDCSLNGPAHVWFHIPSISFPSAERWCQRVRAHYLGAWTKHSVISGFGFSVCSFSRYRYIDSDDEDSDAEPRQIGEDRVESVDRRALTRKAGQTPARRRIPMSSRITWKQEHQSPMQVEKKEPVSSTTRPRMSARVIVDLTDDEEEIKSEGEPVEKPTPQLSIDPFDDPFKPSHEWKDSDFDYPRLHNLREALFDTKSQPLGRLSDDPLMSDVPISNAYSFYAPTGTPVEPDSDVEEAPRVVPDMVLPSRSTFPKLKNSLSAGSQHVFVDTGLCLGRSTRMSFNSNFVLAQKYSSIPHSFDGNGFTIEATPLHSQSPGQRDVLALMLRGQFAAWNGFQNSVESCTLQRPSLSEAFDIPNVFNVTMTQILNDLDDGLKSYGDDNSRHALVVFGLLFALYKSAGKGYIDGDDNLMRRLSEWAEGPAQSVFDEPDLEVTPMRRAVIDLCLGDVEKAVDIAIDQGHLRLAVLMARALEVPKEDLRYDAMDQLVAYRLVDPAVMEEPRTNFSIGDRILEEATEDSPVDINERLILLILAGHVSSVARYLGFSWYRLFIMELVHGAGNSEDPQPDRVAAAVSAIKDSEIETSAPHLNSESELDVAYHMLRLYADPTGKYPITSGVYSSCSFGFEYNPLDARFSWLLHQVLSAIIPEATTKSAPCVLADAFSSQLHAAGLPLWAFYVLCSGGAPMETLKTALIRDWRDVERDSVEVLTEGPRAEPMEIEGEGNMRQADENQEALDSEVRGAVSLKQMSSLTFLQDVLHVPAAWIAEAKALVAREERDALEECKMWLKCETEQGSTNAHVLLTEIIMPEVIVGEEFARYESCVSLLRELGKRKHISNWLNGGGLLLDYMEHVVGVPQEKPLADIVVLHDMIERLGVFKERARSNVQRQCVRVIADGIATAQRAMLLCVYDARRNEMVADLVDDLGRLPVSSSVKFRLTAEYTAEEEKGQVISTRLSGAFPAYGKYLTVDE
ncbi:Nuclear protein [Gracilaria domingensis]|nr:Nuclear protein [Gracilaria domingensis]